MRKGLADRMGKALGVLLAFMIFAVSAPAVQAAEHKVQQEGQGRAPYFLILNPDFPADCFPLKKTDITANVSGMIAEVYVTQTYTNEGDVPVNGQYLFPVSAEAAVHGMKMTIGNQVITACIKEKEEAKETYEEAKSEGKSASLLEQKRPNVFTMDVANIMPGDTILIELHYTELLTPQEDIYKLVLPAVVGPRYIGETGENNQETGSDQETGNDQETGSDGQTGGQESSDDGESWAAAPYLPEGVVPPGEYNITVNLSSGVPFGDIFCKTHNIRVERRGESEAVITLAKGDETSESPGEESSFSENGCGDKGRDYAGNRDFILNYKLAGEEVCSGLVLSDNGREKYFMLTVQPPEHYEPEDIPPREYIFVLDVSGSMTGYPLDTAKTLIRDLVSGLRETDRFNLVLFASDVVLMSEESLPADGWNIREAVELIEDQQGGGGTSMAPALREAIGIPAEEGTARSIVVITDGYVSNDNEIIDMVNQNMDKAGFFSFGIGSSVNDYLIKGIAGAGLGEAFVVTDKEDGEEAARNFRTYIESPLLTDITVDYGKFDVYDVETTVPSVLYARRPIVIFGKWRGEPSGIVRVSGRSGSRDYVQEISPDGVNVDTEGEAVRYLWARTRLDRLAGYGSVRNDASVKEEITRLGLDYNMTTPYTSFVAVAEEVRNPEGEGTDVNQPLPLHVTNLAVGGGYTAYSEPEEAVMLFLMISTIILCLLKRAGRRRHLPVEGRQR